MHKCCNVKLQVVYVNITHVMLYYYYYESFNMHCIVKWYNQIYTQCHVNEVSLGISMVSANTEKPR